MHARRGKIGILAGAFAAGIGLGALGDCGPLWLPFAAGSVGLLATIIARRRGPVALGALAVVACALGVARHDVRRHVVVSDDLAAIVREPGLVRLWGEVLAEPALRPPRGSMAAFHYRAPAAYFPMRVEAIVDPRGRATPCRGQVMVRVEEPVAPFAAGCRLEVTGLLLPPRAPMNPGEFDSVRYARATGQAGLLTVPRRALVQVKQRPAGWPGALHRGARPWLRGRADAWLHAALPAEGTPRRRVLIEALLLGRRGAAFDALGESVRRVGMAHFLAISGLHLGVLVGLVLGAGRLLGMRDRGQGWLTIAVVLVYLAVVEVRMPVLRAGLMVIAASLGLAFGRRYAVGSLVAASAAGLLWWRPTEILSPGFQLSFGVVLGLVSLTPIVRRRWFGPPNLLAATRGAMVAEWLKSTWATAVVAWLIATPVAVYHWCLLWPLAPVLSMAALPLVALVLAFGYASMVLAPLVPFVATLLGVGLAFFSDVLVAVVDAALELPGVAVSVPAPPAIWSVAAAGWIWAWARIGLWGGVPSRALRRALWLSGAALALWLWLPAWRGVGDALRVDMLAVGDGSCYLVRSGRSAVVFDAGSGGQPDAGRRVIVPALRRLGVRALDAVVVSHANLDHYAGALEIAEALPVRSVLVTPQLRAAAGADPEGSVAFLLEGLRRRRVAIGTVAEGEMRVFGAARWRWLHPRRRDAFAQVNDASMVVRIEGEGGTVLLTGDIQATAIAALGERGVPLAAEVLELPHHGAHHRAAMALVETVAPRVILQSTGYGGWRRTEARWSEHLAGRAWLVTARDGACRVLIDADGQISTGRFLRE